jgi:peroxiredoxin 2/4
MFHSLFFYFHLTESIIAAYQITINDLPVGRSVDETLRLIDAFKFTDEHGEVCPANWNPGSASIKANPNDSKAYFQKVHGEVVNGTS